MSFFDNVKVTLKALVLFVFWIVGGLIIFLSGVSIATGFGTYFLDIPILANASSVIGLTIAFAGILMIGYGYRHIHNASATKRRQSL